MLAEPDTVAFLLTIKACSMLSSLDQGILVNAQLVECGYESDVSIGNSLIDMYAKCGSLDDAYSMFEKAPMRTVTTWNAMIGGCSQHSNYELVLEVFEDMQREGVRPNDTTFVSLLSVCNHLGLVSEGCSHFASIWAFDDDSMPYLDHYGCVIELLGKAGCLEEAVCVALTCPFETNSIILTSLLSRCKSYGDSALGRECFDSMTKLGN
jgi:pentatricopeptide repeat protein